MAVDSSGRGLRATRFLRAIRREPVDATPIWIMRQAGRYLPEYRTVREKAGSFLALAKTPELACEVTVQPLRRFDLDAAIVFSDILTVPDAMGLGLHFVDGEGPRLARPVRGPDDILRLGVPDPEDDLRYVLDAVRLARHELEGRAPLIGFSGSPWTLACYMIEGHGSSTFSRAKALALDAPEAMHRLLDVLTRAVTHYLAAQAAAGAQALMVFDTWGGLLAPRQFRELALPSLAGVVAGLRSGPGAGVPVIAFSKGANSHLEALADTGCAALGLDWTVSLGEARIRTGGRVALQGNLDPTVLLAGHDAIRREAAAVLDDFGPHPGHVFNLGHGITPDVDPEAVSALVSAVHARAPIPA